MSDATTPSHLDRSGLLDRLVQHALDNWCVSPMGVPDPDPDYPMDVSWASVHTRTEISDFALRALYQLHYFWAREEGRDINDEFWARYYGDLVLSGGVIPVLAMAGGLPVGCADVTLHSDPWTGHFVGHADHAYVLPKFRTQGAFDGIMSGCVNLGRLVGITRAIIPAVPHLLEMYERHAIKEGWTSKRLCTLLVLEPK